MMIKKMDPPKHCSPIVPKSGIQGDALPDAGPQGSPVHKKKRERDEAAPVVRVRLSEKPRSGAGNPRNGNAGADDEGQGRKKIDVMA
ncbi:hypothetical protein [Desulfococcus sp.]|uniref:hypothetical protein n=1 Tax=Desulfococcus sp. TaxID=2025834 RepID=UPI0035933080